MTEEARERHERRDKEKQEKQQAQGEMVPTQAPTLGGTSSTYGTSGERYSISQPQTW